MLLIYERGNCGLDHTFQFTDYISSHLFSESVQHLMVRTENCFYHNNDSFIHHTDSNNLGGGRMAANVWDLHPQVYEYLK